MKHFFSVLLLILAASTKCFAFNETAIILHHEGQVTVYDGPQQLSTALNDAADGDTLYLGKGSYSGFSITKKIFVRGAGDNQTQINGDISIQIDDEDVEYTEPIIEGLYLYDSSWEGNVYLYYNTKGITIRKCDFYNLKCISGNHDDLTIDRCKIRRYFNYSTSMSNVTIVNSKLYGFSSSSNTGNDVTICNSNIYQFSYNKYFKGSIVNSIIGDYYTYNDYFSYMTMTNTLRYYYSSYDTYNGLESSVVQSNCWTYSSTLMDSSTLDCTVYTDAELLEKGYVGTDGTVIGCNGGATPYTLSLAVPTVAKSEIEVDNAAKLLNVNIKLKANTESEETEE